MNIERKVLRIFGLSNERKYKKGSNFCFVCGSRRRSNDLNFSYVEFELFGSCWVEMFKR